MSSIMSDSGGEAGEVPRAAQFECLMEARLQVAVRGLDRAILVADAGVVAGWLHAVVAAELGTAHGFRRVQAQPAAQPRGRRRVASSLSLTGSRFAGVGPPSIS